MPANKLSKWGVYKRHTREHGAPGFGKVYHHTDGGKGYSKSGKGLKLMSRSAHLAHHNRMGTMKKSRRSLRHRAISR